MGVPCDAPFNTRISMSDLFKNNGAEFSPCRKHRYSLWRIWDEKKPLIMFIGLNPSTANEIEPDPTIRRVIGFANSWGYGGVYMMNLFTIVSSNPAILLNGEKWGNFQFDLQFIRQFADRCEEIVFAWGNFKEAKDRGFEMAKIYPDALCLKKNKNGSPIHPLYVKADIVPVKFIS